MRQLLSPKLLQQIPLLPPANLELEHLIDEEEYAQEEQEEEAKGAAKDENAEDSEASEDDDYSRTFLIKQCSQLRVRTAMRCFALFIRNIL